MTSPPAAHPHPVHVAPTPSTCTAPSDCLVCSTAARTRRSPVAEASTAPDPAACCRPPWSTWSWGPWTVCVGCRRSSCLQNRPWQTSQLQGEAADALLWGARCPCDPQTRPWASGTASRPTNCVCGDVRGPWRSERARGSGWGGVRGAGRSIGGSGSVVAAGNAPGVGDDAGSRAVARAEVPG